MNTPAVVPVSGPFIGGVLMQMVFDVAPVQSPVEQVPVNPFFVAALHAAVLAELVEPFQRKSCAPASAAASTAD
jgi:hypothetical protein